MAYNVELRNVDIWNLKGRRPYGDIWKGCYEKMKFKKKKLGWKMWTGFIEQGLA